MKTVSALELTHGYYQICGERMQRATETAPSRFNRQTGDEIKGSQSHFWRCPNWELLPPHNAHDNEAWPG